MNFKQYTKYKLSKKEYNTLKKLDNEFGEIFLKYWELCDQTDVANTFSEFKKFIAARKEHKKYFPQLKLVVDNFDNAFAQKIMCMIHKFSLFNCYISKFYIEVLNEMLIEVMYCANRNNQAYLKMYNDTFSPGITKEQYEDAKSLLSKHKYIDDDNREENDKHIYSSEEVHDDMQKHIDKRGFDYKVQINPAMVARQNVLPNCPFLQIKKTAMFSKIDIASLKCHEVDVHVARRYYGKQLGLFLMLCGLHRRNFTDEGSAIYNSIHNNPEGIKSNLYFEIAIKTFIAYHLNDKDFCEIFDLLKKTCPEAPDWVLFNNIVRFKRIHKDTSILGGNALSETDYLLGYRFIEKLDKNTREEIIKYNIGPSHIRELPEIKMFFKVNKFDPITNDQLCSKSPYDKYIKELADNGEIDSSPKDNKDKEA